jgi:hypothetical protein
MSCTNIILAGFFASLTLAACGVGETGFQNDPVLESDKADTSRFPELFCGGEYDISFDKGEWVRLPFAGTGARVSFDLFSANERDFYMRILRNGYLVTHSGNENCGSMQRHGHPVNGVPFDQDPEPIYSSGHSCDIGVSCRSEIDFQSRENNEYFLEIYACHVRETRGPVALQMNCNIVP